MLEEEVPAAWRRWGTRKRLKWAGLVAQGDAPKCLASTECSHRREAVHGWRTQGRLYMADFTWEALHGRLYMGGCTWQALRGWFLE